MSKATESNNAWRKKNRKVIQLTVTPEDYAAIKEYSQKINKPVQRVFMDLIRPLLSPEQEGF